MQVLEEKSIRALIPLLAAGFIASCKKALVNFDAIGKDDVEFPLNVQMRFEVKMPADMGEVFVYKV